VSVGREIRIYHAPFNFLIKRLTAYSGVNTCKYCRK
jgi:hypothetical protein